MDRRRDSPPSPTLSEHGERRDRKAPASNVVRHSEPRQQTWPAQVSGVPGRPRMPLPEGYGDVESRRDRVHGRQPHVVQEGQQAPAVASCRQRAPELRRQPRAQGRQPEALAAGEGHHLARGAWAHTARLVRGPQKPGPWRLRAPQPRARGPRREHAQEHHLPIPGRAGAGHETAGEAGPHHRGKA